MPGPTSTTSAAAASSMTLSAPATASSPLRRTGRASTNASGSATPTAAAVACAVATCTLPAPTRSAVSAASRTAPGVWRAPPTTRTVPRSDLSPSESGRALLLSSSRSMRIGVSRFISAPPLLVGLLLRLLLRLLVRLLDTRRLEVPGVREGDELEGGGAPVSVPRQGAVPERFVAVDIEKGALVESLEHEAKAHDHCLVGEHPDAQAGVELAE